MSQSRSRRGENLHNPDIGFEATRNKSTQRVEISTPSMTQLVLEPVQLQGTDRPYDTVLGVSRRYTNPLHFFVSFPDLIDPDVNLVHWYAYTLKKMLYWGLYNKMIKTFTLSGGCVYHLPKLYGIVKEWKEQAIVSGFDVSSNKIDRSLFNAKKGDVFSRVNLSKENDPGIPTEQEYRKEKYLLGWIEGRVPDNELRRVYPGAMEEYYGLMEQSNAYDDPEKEREILDEFMTTLQTRIMEYERDLNLIQMNQGLRGIANTLAERFEAFFNTVDLSGFKECPDFDSCISGELGEEECEMFIHSEDHD
jgi:hypothetical protein